jgi:hypothetical protein
MNVKSQIAYLLGETELYTRFVLKSVLIVSITYQNPLNIIEKVFSVLKIENTTSKKVCNVC